MLLGYAENGSHTWHFYGLAADYGDVRFEPGLEPISFYDALRDAAVGEGLVSGSDWSMRDRPHVQWGRPMRAAPSVHAAQLLAMGGYEAVWREVQAL